MIIARISGGLGNQLFQYAAGRSLALRHNTNLVLDISAYNKDDLRNFELNVFKTNFAIVKPDKIKEFTTRAIPGKIRDKFLPVKFRKVYKEPFFHFDKKFFRAASEIYLKGYWQSEKYFETVKPVIRAELAIKPQYTERVWLFGNELASTTSVAVHIRRADYLSSHILERHGVLKKEYYDQAIKIIMEKHSDARFYFFSDNIEWVKENFKLPGVVYVSNEFTKNHIEDLYLMSQCRHNIIANSSFSWWGAWLNDHPDKTVIAPKKWFHKGPKDTFDLYPDSWIVI